MSFTIDAAITNGEVSIATSGDVPDGTLRVCGHDEANTRSLSVTQASADGHPVQAASSTTYKGA